MSKSLSVTGEVRTNNGTTKAVSLSYEFNDSFSLDTFISMINNIRISDDSQLFITDIHVIDNMKKEQNSDNSCNKEKPKSLWGQSENSDNVHYLSEWTKAEVLPLNSGDTDVACRLSSLLDGLEEMNFELFDEEAVKLMYLLMDRYTGRNKERNMK